MNDFERGTKRIGMSQEMQMNEMKQAIQYNKEKSSNTTPHPQQEYIMTSAELKPIFHYIYSASNLEEQKWIDAENAIQKVLSRPHSSAQSEHTIPDILCCQSLPNENGFCGKNDCFCKELERIEAGEICAEMQYNRKMELLRSKQGEP